MTRHNGQSFESEAISLRARIFPNIYFEYSCFFLIFAENMRINKHAQYNTQPV